MRSLRGVLKDVGACGPSRKWVRSRKGQSVVRLWDECHEERWMRHLMYMATRRLGPQDSALIKACLDRYSDQLAITPDLLRLCVGNKGLAAMLRAFWPEHNWTVKDVRRIRREYQKRLEQ